MVGAIEQAHRILDWHENLTEDEIPPEWMWPLDHELVGWFEEVKRNREAKFGGKPDESPAMMENEYAHGRR